MELERNKFVIDGNTTISKNLELKTIDVYNEKGIMNEKTKKFFMMNEIGNRVWDLIEKPKKVSDIIKILISEYKVDYKKCEESIIRFLSNLKSVNLINIE